MAQIDPQTVEMSDGLRIFSNTSIKIVQKATSVDSEAKYRKAFKTDQINLAPLKCNKVDDVMESSPFSIPDSYIKTEEMTPEQLDERVDYEIDQQDQIWMDEENKKREQDKKKKITMEMLELTIDRLEKETFFKYGGPHEDLSQSPDDVCCICRDGDAANVNQIVYCDMCNIPVHQDCYGVPNVPDGPWFCRKCQLSPMKPVKCELCPFKEGAFKQTDDGKWAHIVCASWIPEITFGNAAFLEPIDGVKNSLKIRAALRCLVCREKMGACVQCSKGNCAKSFHVTCAMEAKLEMIAEAYEDKAEFYGYGYNRTAYCNAHRTVPVVAKVFAENKERAIEAIRRGNRGEECDGANANTTATRRFLPTIDDEIKKRVEERVGDKSLFEDILGYWFYKKKKRHGIPLIRRLKYVKREVVRKAIPRLEMAGKARILYEKARLLADLTEKKEKNYLESITVEGKIMKHLLTPLDDHLIEFIEAISHIDNLKFFRDDPLKQSLVDYNSIVKNPMYLSLMKENAEKGVYKTEGESKEHLDLIFTNCQLYNKANEGVLLYAKEKQKLTNKAYSDLVEYLEFSRKLMDEKILDGETRKEPVREEREREVMMEVDVVDEPIELRHELTPREESNSRKKPKMEDIIDTPSIKRDEMMIANSEVVVFDSSTLAAMSISTLRGISFDSIIHGASPNLIRSRSRKVVRFSLD